eukprot:COSAG02_NODE_5727_length_4089_cov_2.288471_2_plen_87_part_00
MYMYLYTIVLDLDIVLYGTWYDMMTSAGFEDVEKEDRSSVIDGGMRETERIGKPDARTLRRSTLLRRRILLELAHSVAVSQGGWPS